MYIDVFLGSRWVVLVKCLRVYVHSRDTRNVFGERWRYLLDVP